MLLGINPDNSKEILVATEEATMGEKLQAMSNNMGIGVANILDILKWALLAVSLAVIVVLRTGRR